MSKHNAGLSQAFVDKQHERLTALRKKLLRSEDATGGDERLLQSASVDEVQDDGEDSVRFSIGEIDEGVFNSDEHRLAAVERALQKIEEGTYGLSDEGGQPIPQARLEAVPESVYTFEQETAREKRQ
jgi:DnaK suppressor protein